MPKLSQKLLSVEFAKVASVPTPEGTETHRPISHLKLIEWVRDYCRQQELPIAREKYLLSPNGQQMIGLFHLNLHWDGDEEHTYMIALKNCHERKFAAGIAVGAQVKVCANMILSGDWGRKRRHTMHSHPEIAHMIQVGVFQIKQRVPSLRAKLQQLQRTPLSPEGASYRLLQVAKAKQIPIHKIMAIWQEYLHPTHPTHSDLPHTEYRLLMAFTEIAKQETSLFGTLKTYQHISRLFHI